MFSRLKALHPLHALTLLAAAVLCAVLANALARPDRRLAWTGTVPPPLQAPALPGLPSPAVLPAAPGTAPIQPSVHTRPAPKAPPRFPPDPASVVRELSSQEALEAFALHLPFLDARRTADFEEGHVPGAWSVPVWEAQPEARLTAFEAKANPGSRDPIILYCSGGGCEDAHLLANQLVALGYRNLLIYAGGFPDWTAQSRPVAKGPRP